VRKWFSNATDRMTPVDYFLLHACLRMLGIDLAIVLSWLWYWPNG